MNAIVATTPLPPPLSPGSRDPLLFHPDLLPVWRDRTPKLRRLLSMHIPPQLRDDASYWYARVCIADYCEQQRSTGVEVNDTYLSKRFWDHFVPAASRCPLSVWGLHPGLKGRSSSLKSAFSRVELHAFELMLGGLDMRMLIPLEKLHMSKGLTKLGGSVGTAPSYFHLVLRAHAMILQGPIAAAALLDSELDDYAGSLVLDLSLDEVLDCGLAFYGVLWGEMMAFHARKHNVAHEMMRKYSESPLVPRQPTVIPGFLFLQPLIAEALRGEIEDSQGPFPRTWRAPRRFGDCGRLRMVACQWWRRRGRNELWRPRRHRQSLLQRRPAWW